MTRPAKRHPRAGGRAEGRRRVGALLLVVVLVTACGSSRHGGSKVVWQPGTPGPAMAAVPGGHVDSATATAARRPSPSRAKATGTAGSIAPPGLAGGTAAVGDSRPAGANAQLTPEQLAQFKPDELGQIPILEYHQIVADGAKKQQFVRPVGNFRQDLQWLYDHDFYVVPLRDIFLDRISAPAGKHPVALTFDDATAGQFRFLKATDGSVSIDPDSAIGVLEAMFAAHPDFGRGGFFAVPAVFCFDWPNEDDQKVYCAQKLQWLLDHGYEIGNHTVNHVDLLNVDDDTFRTEIGGAVVELRKKAPKATADILAMPFGNYPDKDKHPRQRQWLRDGFEYQGTEVKLVGVLEVGAEPAGSPVSDADHWDPIWTPRIQMCDCDGGNGSWFPIFERQPDILYTSDGNPDTVTIPNALPSLLDGTFDPRRAAADGKEVIRY